MNKVVLIGRWVRDLELKFTPNNGTAVAQGTLAVDRKFKKDSGEKETDFITVVIWGKVAESAVTHTGKGKLCAVSGRIQTRSYEAKDGTKRYITEIVSEELQFIEWVTNKNEKGSEYSSDITEVDDGEIPF